MVDESLVRGLNQQEEEVSFEMVTKEIEVAN